MGNNNELARKRAPEQQQPFRSNGMVRLVDGHRERIAESCGRLVEADTVLSKVSLCLVTVPLEVHATTFVDARYHGCGVQCVSKRTRATNIV